MKQILCLYCEGTDTKIAVFTKEENSIKVIKAFSLDTMSSGSLETGMQSNPQSFLESDAGVMLDGIEGAAISAPTSSSLVEVMMNSELIGLKLNKLEFIPVLTEPAIYYQIISRKTQESKTATGEYVDEAKLKERKLDKQNYGFVELADRSSLTAYLTEDISCFKLINNLAALNGKKFYKITSVKCAEISLAYFVAKQKKFFPDDYSLVVYIGKEYSKLVFMHGRKLKHIGATLDVGTANLHTYDVYFSKILLEMENGGIPNLDNIVVCGEDDSENLMLSFYGTFPEADVSRLEFDNISLNGISNDVKAKISSFSVPIAAANEYFEEQAKQYKGLNLLPNYIKEEQKIFQFGWHGYLILPLLFFTAFYLTMQILTSQAEINKLNTEIQQQSDLKKQNLEILTQIEALDARISSFDQTQAILDSVSAGTEIWGKLVEEIADFIRAKKNFWIRNITVEPGNIIKIEGHALNKFVLTEFATNIESATLRNIIYEPIREKDAYRFTLDFNLKGLVRDAE